MMAYDASNLSALTYANGFTLWHYKTPDGAGDVMAPRYFTGGPYGGAETMLRAGDFIFVNADTDDTVQSAVLVVVHSSHNEGVKVSDISGFGLSPLIQGDAA